MVKKIGVLIAIIALVFFGIPQLNIKANENVDYSYDNLAAPDLEGKQYLGNNEYRLLNESGITIDYNVYSGVISINGTSNSNIYYFLQSEFSVGALSPPNIYSYYYVNGSGTITNFIITTHFYSQTNRMLINSTNYMNYNEQTLPAQDKISRIAFDFRSGDTFNNLQFKLQLEIGDTATDYQVPLEAIEQHIELGNDDGTGIPGDNGDGYDDSYLDGWNDGWYEGFDKGYNKGLNETDATGFVGLLTAVFGGLGALLSIELFPGIYIGAIIAVPLVFGIIFFILGKKKGD